MARKSAPISFSPTDLRLLRIFQAVVRNEGFAAAQSELGLSASTISNHITHLETRFGIRLCDRGRKGFSLTPEGARVLEAAVNLLRSVESFAGTVGSIRGELTGTVHFGTVDAMHTNWESPLHKAIAQFNKHAPGVFLHIEIASPQDLMQRLLAGRYSLILTPIEEVHPSVTADPLYEEEQRLYCGRSHPLYSLPQDVAESAIRQYPYVMRSYMKGSGRVRDEFFQQQAMTSHMEAIAILINSGRYIGYLPVHFAQPFVDRSEMISLIDSKLAYFDTFYLAQRKDERSRAVLLLASYLSETLKLPATA